MFFFTSLQKMKNEESSSQWKDIVQNSLKIIKSNIHLSKAGKQT